MKSRRRVVWIVTLLATGGVVAAEAQVFRKLLVDCLPFKEMTQPPAAFYSAMGRDCWIGMALLALLVIVALRRRAVHWSPLCVALLAPVLVTLLLVAGSLRYGTSPNYAPGFTPAAATSEFVVLGGATSVGISICALVVGAAMRSVALSAED